MSPSPEQAFDQTPGGGLGSMEYGVWSRVDAEFAQIFPRRTPRRPLRGLNAPNATVDDVLEALLALIRHLQPH
jgi:hypothetical protein